MRVRPRCAIRASSTLRSSAIHSALHCNTRSSSSCAVQYALKYIATSWDADLVANILGAPHRPRRDRAAPLGGSAAEQVAVLTILLPDAAEPAKPALASPSTIKHAFAALTSLVQARAHACWLRLLAQTARTAGSDRPAVRAARFLRSLRTSMRVRAAGE